MVEPREEGKVPVSVVDPDTMKVGAGLNPFQRFLASRRVYYYTACYTSSRDLPFCPADVT